MSNEADCETIIRKLKALANPANAEGMARFGISSNNTLGVSIPILRGMATEIGKDHALALQLWKTGIHEARLLAVFVDDPVLATEKQMDDWANDFDSWDVCDQACTDLFDQSPLGWKKAIQWATRKEEFVKRGAFALMAGLAWHDKKSPDAAFEKFFPIIARESVDERNFVKKAVNWALRNIGKRNEGLRKKALACAREIQKTHVDSKAAKWIAADAIRELESDGVKKRLSKIK